MIELLLWTQIGCAKHKLKSEDVPTPQELFDTFEQLSVKEGLEAVELLNIHTVGTVEMALMPDPFSIDSWVIHDKGSLTTIEIPGVGTIVEGYNLKYAWTLDPTSGDRLKSEAELKSAVKDFNRTFVKNYSELYEDAKVVGLDEIEEKEVWKVRAVDAVDKTPTTLFFSKETSLLAGEHRTVPQGKGSLKIKVYYDEYTWVDDMYMPMKMTIKTMGIKQLFTFNSVTINTAETPDIVIPESIKVFIPEAVEDDSTEAEDVEGVEEEAEEITETEGTEKVEESEEIEDIKIEDSVE
jgi:hypothetical protein